MEKKETVEGVVESPKKVAKGKKGIDTPKTVNVLKGEGNLGPTTSGGHPKKNYEMVLEGKESKTIKPTEAPKPKRFENHNLAFAYFLKIINANCLWDENVSRGWAGSIHRITPYRSQRRWLITIAQETLSRGRWIELMEGEYELVTEGTIIPDNDALKIRVTFKDSELKEIISWELIDYHVRMVMEKNSFLSRNLRNYVMEIFAWVDNFVAKEGEEVTMTLEDIEKVESAEDTMKKAMETVQQQETETKE